jgi:hypothetical protein
MSLCECGCGEAAKAGRRFVQGHNQRGATRSAEARAKSRAAMVGFRHTDATKAKMRAAIRKPRAPRTAESRARMAAIMIGKNRIDGLTFKSDGRALTFAPTHPAANEDGRVLRARLVVEERLGRLLTSSEIVHHINFDCTDDHPDNLLAMSRSEHTALHKLLRRLGIEDHFQLWFAREERAA